MTRFYTTVYWKVGGENRQNSYFWYIAGGLCALWCTVSGIEKINKFDGYDWFHQITGKL
jgi:hypothetical protein